ncbi:Protein of unknown function [Micrococcales bacterium KH10]|nr:Protein of unknown function [Micrococcales bacterium KH10]
MSGRILRSAVIVVACLAAAGTLTLAGLTLFGSSGAPNQAVTVLGPVDSPRVQAPLPTDTGPTAPGGASSATESATVVQVADIDITGKRPVLTLQDDVTAEWLDEHTVRFVVELPTTATAANEGILTSDEYILEYQIESPIGSVAGRLADGSVTIHQDNELLFGAAPAEKAFLQVETNVEGGIIVDVSPKESVTAERWEISEPSTSDKESQVFRVRQRAQVPPEGGTIGSLWGTRMIEAATWRNLDEDRKSLAVFPTQLARQTPQIALKFAHHELVQHEPPAETSVMEKQLTCHIYGAATKRSWNLEPWRPDNSLIDYVFHRCNPPIE